jgi:hypothetical protein
MSDIDTTWIEDLESENKFFMQKIDELEILSIYVTWDSDIQTISKETIALATPSILTSEELVGIVQKRKIRLGTHYALKEIMLYNISNTQDSLLELSPRNIFKDIHLNDSISYFKDLNSLVLVFSDKPTRSDSLTRRVFLSRSKRTTRRRAPHPSRRQEVPAKTI